MIDRTPLDIKADVYHTVGATADTLADIESNTGDLLGLTVACREDQFIYFVCTSGTITKTNLRSRETI